MVSTAFFALEQGKEEFCVADTGLCFDLVGELRFALYNGRQVDSSKRLPP